MKNRHLSILIPLLLVLSSVLSSALLFWQEVRIANRSIEQAGVDNLHTALTHLQNMLNTQLAADNLEDAKLSLTVSALHPGIRTLLLADENDLVMLANRYIWQGSHAAGVSGYVESIAQKVRQTQASSVSQSASLLEGYYPVTLELVAGGPGKNRVGVLYVEYDLAPQLAKARYNAMVQAASFGGLMMGVSIIVATLLHLLVTRRVERIVDASKLFAAGDLDARVHLHGGDELAELGQAFDHMAGQRKEAEAALARLNAELERRVAQRTAELETVVYDLENFNYSASHDLRIPLRAIDGFSKLLLDEHAGQLDAEGKRLLKVVRDNVRKMALFIDDMLAFSRIGRAPMAPAWIDMDELLREVAEEVAPVDAAPGFQLEILKLPPAFADRAMMRQVFVNLLANAIKFSGPKEVTKIQVGASTTRQEIIYYVKDNGVGFDMQYADKLFGVFQRLHGVTEFEGAGIGLAIVKRIVTRHGGRVWAEGKVNEGATVYFALPTKETAHG